MVENSGKSLAKNTSQSPSVQPDREHQVETYGAYSGAGNVPEGSLSLQACVDV